MAPAAWEQAPPTTATCLEHPPTWISAVGTSQKSPCMHVTVRLLQRWVALGRAEGWTRVIVLHKSSKAITGLLLTCMVTIGELAEDWDWMAHPFSQGLLARVGTLKSVLVGMDSSRGEDRVTLVLGACWDGMVEVGLRGHSHQTTCSKSFFSPLPISWLVRAYSRVTTRSCGTFAALMLMACLTPPGSALRNRSMVTHSRTSMGVRRSGWSH